MAAPMTGLQDLVDLAVTLAPIRVAVVAAEQGLVVETLRDAHALGFVEPRLIGDPAAIGKMCEDHGWKTDDDWFIPAPTEPAAAVKAVAMVRSGDADAVMKGQIHTDTLMRALLDKENGLRLPGRRVSHVFVVDVSSYPKLLGITDAAINIAPELNAKAEIIRNAVELFWLLGVERPKVAVLSAVETVNPAIVSTLDAACLTLMGKRGQIGGATVDGPLAFDNAVSAAAAEEKGINSEVAGQADIVLVPDLVSGNILAKNLEYLAGATAAGIAVGLSVPVVLSSRADQPAARLAALALASIMHHGGTIGAVPGTIPSDSSFECVPQPEHACCPLPE